MKLSELVTEKRNLSSMNLDELTIIEILELMNGEDAKVALAVSKELKSIEKVVEKTTECMKKGGRLIYIGAGTSGRIGLLDAVECPPTFGMCKDRVVGLLAGGADEIYAKEEAEDSEELGIEEMKKLDLQTNDVVIGIAASGRTPYVIGALKYAHNLGAGTASIACNKGALISKYADLNIEINTGPEVLTGSTRLKAGTAQKMVCNMISTATMIGLGKVYENLMIDVDVSNEKLYHRWLNIVIDATECSLEKAKEMYESSNHNAKIAIYMLKMNCDYAEAVKCLEKNEGFVKKALKNQNK